jgi:hypothetical protein
MSTHFPAEKACYNTAVMSQEEESPVAKNLPEQPTKMVAVRRRTRRRRGESPVKRKTLIFLVVSFVLVFLMVAVPELRNAVLGFMRPLTSRTRIPAEVWALILAGLALLTLIPGVEDKILTVLGLKKKSRSRNSHR